MKAIIAFSLFLTAVLLSVDAYSRAHSSSYLSLNRKVDAMRRYVASPTQAGLTTVMSDPEMNAWFAEGGVDWPAGMSNVRIHSRPAVVEGMAQVDFDELTGGKYASNPLMMLFSGTHDVRVVAQATASRGRGSVRVDSVYLDDVKVPRAALEYFINQYLKPKYPEAGLNAAFAMPERIDSAIVGDGQITFIQK